MTAPDPGLTDLIAAHQLKQSYWNWWGCTGCDWRTKGTYGSEPTTETATEHAKHVVEQHTNWRIAELEDGIMRAIHELIETRERAEKAEATIARLEKALEGVCDSCDYTDLRAALEGPPDADPTREP